MSKKDSIWRSKPQSVAEKVFKNTLADVQQHLTDRYFYLAEIPPRGMLAPKFEGLRQTVALDVVEEAMMWSVKSESAFGMKCCVEATTDDPRDLRKGLLPFLKSSLTESLNKTVPQLERRFLMSGLDEPLGTGIVGYTTKVQQAVVEGIALGLHEIDSVFTSLITGKPSSLMQEKADGHKETLLCLQKMVLPVVRPQSVKLATPLTTTIQQVAFESVVHAFEVATRPESPTLFSGGILAEIGVPSAFQYDPKTPPVLKTESLVGREMGKVVEAIWFDLLHGDLQKKAEGLYKLQMSLSSAGGYIPVVTPKIYAQASEPVRCAFHKIATILSANVRSHNDHIIGVAGQGSYEPHTPQNFSLH